MVVQTLVTWGAAGSPGGQSVLHSDTPGNAAIMQTAFDEAIEEWGSQFAQGTTCGWDGTYRELDTATGELEDLGNVGAPWSFSTIASAQPVANGTQALVRWRTAAVVAGRLVQGRTYIPGIAVNNLDGGQLSTAQQSALRSAMLNVVQSGGLFIWSRPTLSRPGSIHQVVACDVWSELAVQRRRR